MDLTVTNLTLADITQAMREELKNFFAENQIGAAQADADEIGGIELAMEVTGLAKPTIYGLCSVRNIPHSKRGKMLYFSRKELTEWLTQGKRRTQAEIATEAETFGQKEKEAIQPTKARNRFLKG